VKHDFPADGVKLTVLRVWKIRSFFRDPDGHLLEMSESKHA